MKFNLDMAREIMIAVEECPTDIFDEHIPLAGKEVGDHEVSFIVRILGDQGYLEVNYIPGSGPGREFCFPYRITGNGVDFVRTFRDVSMWQHTKDTASKHTRSPTLALLQTVASESLKLLFRT